MSRVPLPPRNGWVRFCTLWPPGSGHVFVNPTTRSGFLNLAAAFEGGTLFLGLFLGWATGVFTPKSLRLEPVDFAWGVLAFLPMVSILFLATDLKQQVRELLGQSLAACRWYDLAALAVLAGVSEELLFRGVLEPWMGRSDPWFGMVAANVLFGFAHAVSPTYFVFAMLIGIYFSLINRGWPDGSAGWQHSNLLRPMVAHAVYDFVAFLMIVRDYRQSSGGPPESAADR